MNETLNKKFGEKLDIENYSDAQLAKANSLIESRIAVLKKGKFNETLDSEEFHRLKLMQDIVRTAITERAKNPYAIGMAAAKKQAGYGKKPAHDLPKSVVTKGHEIAKKIKEGSGVKDEGNAFGKAVRDAKKDGVQKGEKIKVGGKTYPVKEAAKPDYLDLDKDGNKKEPMKKAAKDKKVDEVSNAMKQRAVDAGLEKAAAAKKAGWSKKGDEKKGKKADASRDTFRKKTDQAGRIVMKMKESVLKEMTADVENWVNSHHANFKFPHTDDWDKVQDKVHKMLLNKGFKITHLENEEDVLIVFMYKDTPVAWYDFENAHGYYRNAKNPKHNYAPNRNPSPYLPESIMRESIQRYLAEGEEGKAEIIMAVKDMVDKFTNWSENIAQMQAQTAMEMADSIRNEMGPDQAEQFTSAVQPALDAAFQAVKSAREALNTTVGTLTGEAPAAMGAEPGMPGDDMGGDMDMGVGPDMGDDMGMDADMGGDDMDMEPDVDVSGSDRMKRESIENRLRLTKILAGR
jgi:hypothetical protein